MSDDDGDLPPALAMFMGRVGHDHDAHAMAHEDLALRIYQFLDSLTVEQALVLRCILNQDQKSALNQYYDGQLVSLMRRVHHVDPDTGRSLEDELTPEAAT